MKLLQIDQIEKKQGDVPIYYRKDYRAQAMFEKKLHHHEQLQLGIDFSIEMEPTGHKKVEVQILEDVDYPLMPLLHSLKKEIKRMEAEGHIPW